MNTTTKVEELPLAVPTAPCVTPADIEAAIAREHYFTAAEGVYSSEVLNSDMISTAESLGPLGMLTFCVLVMRNGHTVTGESHCADPAKFNAETGRVEARKRAIDQLWPMVVYAERERLHNLDKMREKAGLLKTIPSKKGA